MKKLLFITIVSMLLILNLCPSSAAGEFRVGISGSSIIRAGDTVIYTIKVENISGITGGIAGLQGEISYDSNVMSYQKFTSKLGSDWQLELNPSGNTILFVAYDNTAGSKSISSNAEVFTITFKVSSNAKTNSKVQFVVSKTTGTDKQLNSVNASGSNLTSTVAAPLSDNNYLSSLSVDQNGMTPIFNKNTDSYSLTVPFNIDFVKIDAKTENSKATITISGNKDLIPETVNVVTVTVKAENGATRVYKINVTRERDPDKPLSENSNLSDISIDKSILSPAFSKEITNYLVWLPYEIDELSVAAIADENSSSIEIVGGDNLIAGADNEVLINVTAENGSTRQYKIIVKRAAAHESQVSSDEDSIDSNMEESSSSIETSSEDEIEVPQEPSSRSGFNLLLCLIIAIIAAVTGFFAGRSKKFGRIRK